MPDIASKVNVLRLEETAPFHQLPKGEKHMETSNKRYREKLVQQIKDAGEELIKRSEKRLEKANLNYQNHILVAAQDIDMVVALMCYIQLSLLGVAAYIKVGNSLTEPMTENDSLDNYWFTMMYFSDIWSMRRLLRSL